MTVVAANRVSTRASFLEVRRTPARVVLVGGSGHVGNLLARHFRSSGTNVCVVARTTFSVPWRVVAWDGAHSGPWVGELEGTDVVINLAGRSVNCRYHRWNRREI